MSQNTDERLDEIGATAGMPVLGCIQGSAADAAGIQIGDRILEVNGMPVSDASSYVAARNLETDLMHVVLRRNGKFLKFTLHFDSFVQRAARPDLTLN